jgi:hypothetical protein
LCSDRFRPIFSQLARRGAAALFSTFAARFDASTYAAAMLATHYARMHRCSDRQSADCRAT